MKKSFNASREQFQNLREIFTLNCQYAIYFVSDSCRKGKKCRANKTRLKLLSVIQYLQYSSEPSVLATRYWHFKTQKSKVMNVWSMCDARSSSKCKCLSRMFCYMIIDRVAMAPNTGIL